MYIHFVLWNAITSIETVKYSQLKNRKKISYFSQLSVSRIQKHAFFLPFWSVRSFAFSPSILSSSLRKKYGLEFQFVTVRLSARIMGNNSVQFFGCLFHSQVPVISSFYGSLFILFAFATLSSTIYEESSQTVTIVKSWSMYPAFSRGDLLLAFNRTGDFSLGDVVLFEVSEMSGS